MWQLAAAFIDIALRRRGPENLPESTFLVVFLVVVQWFVSLAMFSVHGALTWASIGLILVDFALFFAFVFAVLRFFKLERRYLQTVSAMLGADICISLAYLPFALTASLFAIDLLESQYLWIYLVFYLWSVYIASFLLARSLSQPFIVGLMFEILFILTTLGISDLISPPAA